MPPEGKGTPWHSSHAFKLSSTMLLNGKKRYFPQGCPPHIQQGRATWNSAALPKLWIRGSLVGHDSIFVRLQKWQGTLSYVYQKLNNPLRGGGHCGPITIVAAQAWATGVKWNFYLGGSQFNFPVSHRVTLFVEKQHVNFHCHHNVLLQTVVAFTYASSREKRPWTEVSSVNTSFLWDQKESSACTIIRFCNVPIHRNIILDATHYIWRLLCFNSFGLLEHGIHDAHLLLFNLRFCQEKLPVKIPLLLFPLSLQLPLCLLGVSKLLS